MRRCKILSLLATVAIVSMVSARAVADPLPGEVLKFRQLPLNNALPPGNPNGAPYPGHDEWSTARPSTIVPPTGGWQGTFMADDFADNFSTPVVHVKWWGSYENNINENLATQFLITFETDVPFDPLINASRPGTPILSQIVKKGALAPASGTFQEQFVNGAVQEHLYQYNAELALPFNQAKDTVYWIKIVALNDPAVDGGAFNWGWHNRDWSLTNALFSPNVAPGERVLGTVVDSNGTPRQVWHFQDDAVSGSVGIQVNAAGGIGVQQTGYTPQNYVYSTPGAIGVDGPQGIQAFSKDLAFELYTIPEPAAVTLVGAGIVGLGLVVRKRRRQPLSA